MRNKTSSWGAALVTLAAGHCNVLAAEESGKGPNEEEMKAGSIYDFTVMGIDGNDVKLAEYKGYVCVIVNVASL